MLYLRIHLVDFYGKLFECKFDIYHTWILWVMGLFCWDYALVDTVTPRSEGRRALSCRVQNVHRPLEKSNGLEPKNNNPIE